MAYTRELLVQTTATLVPRTNVTRSIEVFNMGPYTIWGCVGGTPVEFQSRRIQPGESWGLDLGSDTQMWLLASTANQSSGSATIITEVP